MKPLLVFAALLFALPAHAEVTIDWVTVGDPGNACDVQSQSCFGGVSYEYRISTYEVTNAQYAAFLNAVAATDTHGLYSTGMGSDYGGITRSGSPGSYTYGAIAGREGMPVNYVSFYDALRFANWLHNGQPTGAQDSTTTEDGAYTMITESFPSGPFITRNPGAKFFLTSEDEWYKAAYYDTALDIYYEYPVGSDTQTTCAVPGATANIANCNWVVGDLTDVGSYTGLATPYGTFDQGGNVWEWNEANSGLSRGLRGGSFSGVYPEDLAASSRYNYNPVGEYGSVGFRVASRCSSAPSLGPVGLLVIVGLLGFIGYRWRRV